MLGKHIAGLAECFLRKVDFDTFIYVETKKKRRFSQVRSKGGSGCLRMGGKYFGSQRVGSNEDVFI